MWNSQLSFDISISRLK